MTGDSCLNVNHLNPCNISQVNMEATFILNFKFLYIQIYFLNETNAYFAKLIGAQEVTKFEK